MADADSKLEEKWETSESGCNEIKEELKAAQALAEERLDLLMRCRADLDNVLKRSTREKEENIKYASEKLVCKLLPVLDSLEQAAKVRPTSFFKLCPDIWGVKTVIVW